MAQHDETIEGITSGELESEPILTDGEDEDGDDAEDTDPPESDEDGPGNL
jgi:hypothetical protein